MPKLRFIPLVVLVFSSAFAQQARIIPTDDLKAVATETGPRSPIRNATLELLYSHEGRAAISDYRNLRAAGKIPFAAKSSSYSIGDRKMFQMRNLDVPDNTIQYDNLEFELRAQEAGLFNIWVEVAELTNGHVRAEDVEEMRVSLGESTSATSFDPGRGVVSIDNEVFGSPPDVDGDGILDVLVGDIRDGYTGGGGGIVLGFFDPANLSGRNMADIIYLDSYPGIVNSSGIHYPYDPPSQTLAHEYQHLIFATTNGDSDISFVNEGLSEWAEVITGFTARPISYFQSATERRHPLLDFRDLGELGQDFDYQRAGLFTNYLGDRIGVLNTGAISRSTGIGAYGYYDVVSKLGLSLPDVIRDFHVANYLNDRSQSEAYGYSTPQRTALHITGNIPTYDGTASNHTAAVTGTISPGGAQYVAWTKVRDLLVDVSETNGRNSLLAPVLIAQPEIGPVEITIFDAGTEPYYLVGSYSSVVLVLPHVYLWDPNEFSNPNPPSAAYKSSADWENFQSVLTTTVYDSGQAAVLTLQTPSGPVDYNALAMSPTGQKANRFEVPQGTVLREVQIDQPYEHDFSGSNVSPDAPRDFTLVIWDEDANGRPGNELFTLDVDDQTPSGFGTFMFQKVDLTPYEAQLAALPPVIFIGDRNRGSDVNYLLMTVSTYSGGSSPSFMYDPYFAQTGPSPWESFNNFCIGTCDDIDMANYVLPIRATFGPASSAGPTANEDEGVLPASVTLEQNYPNPFNPQTSIRYSLPASGRVSLVVYDMLGRKIRVLVDAVESAGTHEVRFDASGLASGIYLYALRSDAGSGSKTVTRTMSVLK